MTLVLFSRTNGLLHIPLRRIAPFEPCISFTVWFQVLLTPSRGTFQFSLTVLLHYRSQYVFRVRSWCLPFSWRISDPQYSGTLQILHVYAYGTFTLCGISFQINSASHEVIVSRAHTPHPYDTWVSQVQFALCPFRSPLLRTSHLLSFPPPTKMFQFRGFPFLSE